MTPKRLKESFFLFIVITIAIVNTVYAQRTYPEKHDNLIYIIDNNSPEENFMSFGRFLVEEGFSFASKDKDFLILRTNERTSQGGYKYTLTIALKDSIISIRPRCNYVLFGSSIGNIKTEWTDWAYAKPKKSAVGIAYNAFEPILRKYNGKLYFTKE